MRGIFPARTAQENQTASPSIVGTFLTVDTRMLPLEQHGDDRVMSHRDIFETIIIAQNLCDTSSDLRRTLQHRLTESRILRAILRRKIDEVQLFIKENRQHGSQQTTQGGRCA